MPEKFKAASRRDADLNSSRLSAADARRMKKYHVIRINKRLVRVAIVPKKGKKTDGTH